MSEIVRNLDGCDLRLFEDGEVVKYGIVLPLDCHCEMSVY
jgi:hypothetical protein